MGGNGHHQAAVLHAFEADEPIGKLFYRGRLAVDNQRLETGVVVQVRVAGGDDQVMTGVLKLGQLFRNSTSVMVVNQGDSADDGRIGCGGLLGHQPVADQIPECFRAVGVASMADGPVEPLEEVRVQRNADSAQESHGCSCSNSSTLRRSIRIARMRKSCYLDNHGGDSGAAYSSSGGFVASFRLLSTCLKFFRNREAQAQGFQYRDERFESRIALWGERAIEGLAANARLGCNCS